MWDDFFDLGDVVDVASDASDVADFSTAGEVAYDWGTDYGDPLDFGDVVAAPSGPGTNGTGVWLEGEIMPDDSALYGENVWDGGGDWGDFEPPANDYGFDPYSSDAQSYLYGSPIGPGLNGMPGMAPTATSESGWFGGVKSALGSIFSGNPNNATVRSQTYGRSVMYRQNGNVYQTAPQNGLQGFIRSLTGQKSGGAGFGGGSGDNTMLIMVAGLAILGVAVLAKR